MQLHRFITAAAAVGAAIALHNTDDDAWKRHMGWAVNLLGETAEMLLDVITDAAERLQRRAAE